MNGSFELTILGCSSATPTSNRNPSAQLLNIAERFFLIDCGEGTQMQLRKYKLKFQRINCIFISHLHGDHYLGLMGLLSSMHLLGRVQDLTIYCPEPLKEIIEVQQKHSQAYFNYKIHYHFLKYDAPEVILEDERLRVRTVLLNHRIDCCGFVFEEKVKPLNMLPGVVEKYKIPVAEIPAIKAGADFTTINGDVIKNAVLTTVGAAPRSYAYCSDTCYDERILESIKGVDLLYHEATFMDAMKERAKETYHSTTLQAATIALKAGVKKLMIGHFSARYGDLEPLLEESRSIFENTLLAKEGEHFSID